MKIWEAIQMLEQMDKTKECTVTFGEAKVAKPPNGGNPNRDYVYTFYPTPEKGTNMPFYQ